MSSRLFAAYFTDDQYTDSLEAVTLADGSTAYIQRNAQGTDVLLALGRNPEINQKVCVLNPQFFSPLCLRWECTGGAGGPTG